MRTARTTIGLLLLLGLVVAGVHAQDPALTGYELKFYAPGAPNPQKTQLLSTSGFVCNQDLPANPTTVNPDKVVITDDAHAGKVCLYQAQAGDELLAFPAGAYEATLAAVYETGIRSPETNRAPFRWFRPGAPTGFGLIR